MIKTDDPAIAAIRKVRREISHEFDNDPARLIEHYVEMQRRLESATVIRGPESDSAEASFTRDAVQLGR